MGSSVREVITGDKVCGMTGFDTSVPPLFGLPRTLPG
jgi:hypothetical protein